MANHTPILSPEQSPERASTRRPTILLLIGLAILVVIASAGFLLYPGISNMIATNNAHATATARANAANTALAQDTGTAVAVNQTFTAQDNATATADVAATASTIAANPDPYPPHGSLALYDPLNGSNDGPGYWNYFANPSIGERCQFTGNAYHVSTTKSNSYSYCYPSATFSNFAFEVKMDIIRGDCGGIVFRFDSNSDRLYFFGVCQNGTYGLYIYYNNTGNNITTLEAGSTSALTTGYNRTNIIAVVADHSTFTLYINRQNIASAHDSTYTAGLIGIIADDYTATTEVAYTDARVWTF